MDDSENKKEIECCEILTDSQICTSIHGEEDEPSSEHSENEKHSFLDGLTQELQQIQDCESKLQRVIDFMASSLAQTGVPHFRSFWQARMLCLELFKEHIVPPVRAAMWAKYSELSKEARRLKDLLDEQSAFAVEQIEIAIQALEDDLSKLENVLSGELPEIISPETPSLAANAAFYDKSQRELDLLNTYASRINAMRKELIKTEMRVRKKNKFFQRLSGIGDKIFPRRKELIKNLSTQFIADVDAFINQNFSRSRSKEPAFALREEIKSLQGVAKRLTLNSHAFAHSRLRLSECWDKLKEFDKERKLKRAEEKASIKEQLDGILKKVEAVHAQELSPTLALQKIDEISHSLRQQRFGREEVSFLKESLNQARQPYLQKIEQETQAKIEQEKERSRVRLQKLQHIQQEIEELIAKAHNIDIDAITKERDSLLAKIESNSFLKSEKQELEKKLKPLRDIIADKKEKTILSFSKDAKQTFDQLHDILKQRKDRRNEIKSQIDILRKANGSSGLDFGKAMGYQTQISEEKERLEKIEIGIQEIEQKIAELSEQAQVQET